MPTFQDLTGNKYGRLLVKERAADRIQPSGQHCRMWICLCDCGNECIVSAQNLKSGHTKSCGCLFKETASKSHLDDLTGRFFGNVYVKERAGSRKYQCGQTDVLWLCECVCGKEFVTHASSLRSGATTSCGCSKRIDLTGQQIYWLTVIARAPDYINQKGEAITRWLCKCKCGQEIIVRTSALTSNATKSCGCLGSSVAENEIKHLLNELNIKFKKEYTFKDLKSGQGPKATPRFDFGILTINNELLGLIEYQGPHHYIPRFKNWGDAQRLRTDPLKREYCKKNNIPLLEIPYTEDFKSLILSFLKDINALHVNPVPSSE